MEWRLKCQKRKNELYLFLFLGSKNKNAQVNDLIYFRLKVELKIILGRDLPEVMQFSSM